MNDYIYGVRREDGYVELDSEFTEQSARSWGNDVAIRVPVSAIEPLPAPKPALPTTPGSVVRVDNRYLFMLDEAMVWVKDNEVLLIEEMLESGWTLVFDAGAHDEGKS